LTGLHVYGQEAVISVKTDTLTNEIITSVSLIHIPEGGRARFQQRLLASTNLVPLPFHFLLWDTSNCIFTLITGNYPAKDTLTFSFVCKIDTLPDMLTWGEAALMYEDRNKQVHKINIPAKNYLIRQQVDTANPFFIEPYYYIQVSASKTQQKRTDLSKHIRLQTQDVIMERKENQYYKYFVGNFTTKEQASEKLKYYRKYVPDAFIVRF
jgi:hypothetical protein